MQGEEEIKFVNPVSSDSYRLVEIYKQNQNATESLKYFVNLEHALENLVNKNPVVLSEEMIKMHDELDTAMVEAIKKLNEDSELLSTLQNKQTIDKDDIDIKIIESITALFNNLNAEYNDILTAIQNDGEQNNGYFKTFYNYITGNTKQKKINDKIINKNTSEAEINAITEYYTQKMNIITKLRDIFDLSNKNIDKNAISEIQKEIMKLNEAKMERINTDDTSKKVEPSKTPEKKDLLDTSNTDDPSKKVEISEPDGQSDSAQQSEAADASKIANKDIKLDTSEINESKKIENVAKQESKSTILSYLNPFYIFKQIANFFVARSIYNAVVPQKIKTKINQISDNIKAKIPYINNRNDRDDNGNDNARNYGNGIVVDANRNKNSNTQNSKAQNEKTEGQKQTKSNFFNKYETEIYIAACFTIMSIFIGTVYKFYLK
ncbi:hypothetical protein BDAP_001200 [Binucleata daphniae]